jgi:hypothetical protein
MNGSFETEVPGWLLKYGVDPDQLPEDLQELADNLGEDGVRKLIQESRRKTPYRCGFLTSEERIDTLERLQRLRDLDGIDWELGEPDLNQNPEDWLPDEEWSLWND